MAGKQPLSDTAIARLGLRMISSQFSTPFRPDAALLARLQDVFNRLGIKASQQDILRRFGDAVIYLWTEDGLKAAILIHDKDGSVLFLPDAYRVDRGGSCCGNLADWGPLLDGVLKELPPTPDVSA